MISSLKIYISDSFNVYENLAIERLLLDSVDENTLILYLWQNENTVVIGRNQNPWAECNCTLLQKEGGYLARRLSGGGAVFHDKGNLNFTFLCHSENYNLAKQMKVIQDACSLAGIETLLSGRNDILADGRKFSGNAFYNSRGKSYHHGTIMISADFDKMKRYLTPSEAKLSAKGIKSVRSRVVNLNALAPDLTSEKMKEHMISSFEKIYGMKSQPSYIDTNKIQALKEDFSSPDYLYKKTPPFSFTVRGKFSWGEIEIGLDVTDGIITEVQIFTDAMDWTLAQKTKDALTGCAFKKGDIEKVLSGDTKTDILSLFEI